METGSFSEIGFAVRTHGVKGHLRISFYEHIKALSKSEALFFLVKGKSMPFFIEDIEYLNNGDALVLLEDVRSKESADILTKKIVFGPDSYFVEIAEESTHSYIGFLVSDIQLGDLGLITGVTPMSDYDLLYIDYHGRELLIAMHPDLIVKEEPDKKMLLINAPDGILDM